MKRILNSRFALTALCLVASALLFIFGKGDQHMGELLTANIAAVSLTAEEKAEFGEPEQKMLLAVKKMVAQVQADIKSGKISEEEAATFKHGVIDSLKNGELAALKTELQAMDKIAKEQGILLNEMSLKLATGAGAATKSIGEVLQDNLEEITKVYQNGSGTKTFMVNANAKGELVMRPFDMTKAAGPHATIAAVGAPGNTASIAQSIDAATLLRLGGASQIVSNYRNTPWIFDLCNVVNAGWEQPFAMWYEEQAKQGASATVAEGATKPSVQYAYTLKSSTYKKEAALIGFTEEFSLDFSRLQDDIMNKGRVDLVNRINAALLTNVTAAATAYNTAASFNGGVALASANDYVVLAAMAAQVDHATYGANANTALMSTFKKYRLGTLQATGGEWIDRPSVLDGLAFVGNPDMAANDVMVGDLKAYNVLLRGGFIVKVGYNGTDFAENRFSVVMEQYYFDYISDIRKKAIVKGADFATVATALTT